MIISSYDARQGFTRSHHPVSRVLVISTILAVICLGFVTYLT